MSRKVTQGALQALVDAAREIGVSFYYGFTVLRTMRNFERTYSNYTEDGFSIIRRNFFNKENSVLMGRGDEFIWLTPHTPNSGIVWLLETEEQFQALLAYFRKDIDHSHILTHSCTGTPKRHFRLAKVNYGKHGRLQFAWMQNARSLAPGFFKREVPEKFLPYQTAEPH